MTSNVNMALQDRMYTHGEVVKVHPNGRICYKVPCFSLHVLWFGFGGEESGFRFQDLGMRVYLPSSLPRIGRLEQWRQLTLSHTKCFLSRFAEVNSTTKPSTYSLLLLI